MLFRRAYPLTLPATPRAPRPQKPANWRVSLSAARRVGGAAGRPGRTHPSRAPAAGAQRAAAAGGARRPPLPAHLPGFAGTLPVALLFEVFSGVTSV